MLTYYTALLSIHVLAAVTWVGSNISAAIHSQRVQGRGGTVLAQYAKDIEWYGKRVLAPASLVLIITGVLLTVDGDWGFADPWVMFALTAWLFSFLLGIAFLGPTSARIGSLMDAAGGNPTPEAEALLERLFLLSRIELVVLVAVVVDMVVKPGA